MPELVGQEIVRARVAFVLVDFDHFAAGGTVFLLPGANFGCCGGEGCFCGRWGLGGGCRVSGEDAGNEEELIWKVSKFVVCGLGR